MNGKLKNLLASKQKYALDTNIFIYFFENHPDFGDCARQIIQHALTGQATIVTSIITPIELFSLKDLDQNITLKKKYQHLIEHPQIQIKELTKSDAEGVAKYRRTYGLKTADAIQMYTAASLKAEVYFTNDKIHKRIMEHNIILLQDLLS